MAGYALMIGQCFCCKKMFPFNPVKVPSIRYEGRREPICKECIEYVNPLREKNGLDPIVPHPDAYKACDERELG